MIIAIITTVAITVALGTAQGGGRRNPMISRHRYNNRYSDASGAREDYLG